MVTMFFATYKRPGKTIFAFFFQKTLKILHRHFYSKKVKIEKIELQACYVPQMKAENMYNSYSGIKNRIFIEKKFFLKFLIFWKFWKNLFSKKISKFSKKFQKWPPQDFSNKARNKVTKNQPIWGIQRGLTYNNRQGGVNLTPPHVE